VKPAVRAYEEGSVAHHPPLVENKPNV
jgi:hypothetical protein